MTEYICLAAKCRRDNDVHETHYSEFRRTTKEKKKTRKTKQMDGDVGRRGGAKTINPTLSVYEFMTTFYVSHFFLCTRTVGRAASRPASQPSGHTYLVIIL